MGDQVLLAIGSVLGIIFLGCLLVFGVISLINKWRKRNGKIKIRMLQQCSALYYSQQGCHRMDKAERLRLALAQAEIAVRLLADGRSIADVSETCDIPVATVKALNDRLDKAEADGFDRSMVAAFLTALIKRKKQLLIAGFSGVPWGVLSRYATCSPFALGRSTKPRYKPEGFIGFRNRLNHRVICIYEPNWRKV